MNKRSKCIATINNCFREDHFKVAEKMVENFYQTTNDKKVYEELKTHIKIKKIHNLTPEF